MDCQSGRHVFGWDPTFSASPPAGLALAELAPAARRRNPANGFRSLPSPTGQFPFHLDLAEILDHEAINAIATSGKLVFQTVGDTGQKSNGAAAQEAVAHHMVEQFRSPAADRPHFFYHLGDVVYFNGARDSYEEQFYDPYKNYPGPIFAIPGNHDGAVPRGDSPLQGFMENFCSPQPQHSEFAGESTRTTMTQPNCYWTLRTPFGRIIGLYSNVPGALDRQTPQQRNWLTEELRNAADERCVIVAVHHPPYSRDTSHGGYEAIGNALDAAFRDSGRVPTLVLNGHVHNYQRFERDMSGFGVVRTLPYVVAGAGGFAGYDTLHQIDVGNVLPSGVAAQAQDDSLPGFLRITLTATEIVGEYFVVPRPPRQLVDPAIKRDEFRVTL